MADAALPIEGYSARAKDALQEIAEKRLRPALSDPNFLVLRSRRVIFQDWIAQLPDKELSILDVGGRYQPYRPLFTGRIKRYIGFDLLRTDFVDVVGNGESLPFASGSFDLIIATQVFDCFKEPHRAAQQIHSVLKPGGALLASIPSMAPQFSDGERWRFTASGVRSVLSIFSEIQIVPEQSSLGGMLRTINLALHSFVPSRILKRVARNTLVPCINLSALGLEALHITNNNQFTPNYSVLAIK
ncbi:MAG TPA: class I SAM-dependent methyltransferase [Terriglobales bacterium]